MGNKSQELDYSFRTEYKYHTLHSSNKILDQFNPNDSLVLTDTDKNKSLDDFIITLKQFIKYQIKKDTDIIDLSFIHFPYTPPAKAGDYEDIYYLIVEILGEKSNKIKEINFYECHFHSRLKINKDIKHKLDFTKVTFHAHTVFNDISIKKEIDFSQATFKENALFVATNFKQDAYFDLITVDEEIYFVFAVFLKRFNMGNASFSKIHLEGMDFSQANLLGLKGLHKQEISEDNFVNKESARLIKSHFETEKNIIESNKYFRLEQELYLDELKDQESMHTNKLITKVVLYLNKFVSDFGTDWVRPLIVMIIFSFFVSFVYNLFDIPKDINIFLNISQSDRLLYSLGGFLLFFGLYLVYHFKKNILIMCCLSLVLITGWILYISNSTKMVNDIALIMNPLNMFKSKDYFEHIAPFGMFAKLVISVLLYQFIMAFRNNTRRK